MTIENLFICLFLIAFIFFILLLVKYISIQMIKMRAKKYHVCLKTNDAKKLINMGSIDALFFKQVSFFILQGLEFDIIHLGLHYISGGSLENVLKGVLYARKNKIDIEFSEICTIDLAGKDILDALKKGKPYLI